MVRIDSSGSPSQFPTPYRKREGGKVIRRGAPTVPVSQPSIEGGKLGSWDGLRPLAHLLARGYLRLLSRQAHTAPPVVHDALHRIPVDSTGQESDELAAGTPGGRPRCKPV
jgi:hypothetical protein